MLKKTSKIASVLLVIVLVLGLVAACAKPDVGGTDEPKDPGKTEGKDDKKMMLPQQIKNL